MDTQKGNTAEVFEYEPGKVCKLFYHGIPYEYAHLEYENAQKLFALEIRVPRPFGQIEIGGRHGIIYEKINGISLRDCIDEEYAFQAFVREHKKLLNISSSELMSYKDFLLAVLQSKTGQIPSDFLGKLATLPDGNQVLHGDYHPENIMLTPAGELVIIDLLNVCRGSAAYDVARTFFLLKDEALREKYLKAMGYRREEIAKYLDVIEITRKYE